MDKACLIWTETLFMPQIFFHFLQRKAQNIMKLFEVCVTSKQKAEDTNIVT